MSKERLEEIKKNLDPLGDGMGGHLISVNDIYWLVEYAREQAERVQELKSFKNSVEYTVDSETLELIINNQDNDKVLSLSETYDEKIYLLQKRVQELEEELEKGETLLEKILPIYKRLKKQNKRYREYLELIKTTGTYGKDISTGEILRTYEANLADEALEGEE